MFHKHGSLTLFLKIYELCVQERRLVTTAVSVEALPATPPYREPGGREAEVPTPYTATCTLRVGGSLGAGLSETERASLKDETFDSLPFCLYLISYQYSLHPTDSPFTSESQQLREHRKPKTKAVYERSSTLKTEVALLQDNV